MSLNKYCFEIKCLDFNQISNLGTMHKSNSNWESLSFQNSRLKNTWQNYPFTQRLRLPIGTTFGGTFGGNRGSSLGKPLFFIPLIARVESCFDTILFIFFSFFSHLIFIYIFPSSIVGNTNTLNLRVKIESANGLLVWTGGDEMSPASDFLLLGIENGFLHFRFNLGNGEGGVIYNDTRIDDGKWHRLRATR